MKHEIKITAVLLFMFLITQLIGLVVIDAYSPLKIIQIEKDGKIVNKTVGGNVTVPYGMEPPKLEPKIAFGNIFIALVIAILIFILLMKLKARTLIHVWFTLVVFLTVSIALTALLSRTFPAAEIRFDLVALVLAIPLTFYKIFRRNLVVHNLTELLIYPGLAAIFVPILRVWSILLLLILISIYDMYAVWKSKIMVNLAKYQIKNLRVFTGFFVPYLPKKEYQKLQRAKALKVKGKKMLGKIKVSLALLGGGDVAFPLLFAGVMLRWGGGLIPALIIVGTSTLALLGLFLYSKKGKFYPAMPFITAGCIIGWLITLLL